MDQPVIPIDFSAVRKALTDNKIILFLYALMIASVAVGPCLYRTYFFKKVSDGFSALCITAMKSESTVYIFLFCLILYLAVTAVAYVSGISAAGFVIAPAALSAFGLGLGAVAAHFYSGYGLKGLLFCLAVIFPTALAESVGLILSVRESVVFSLMIRKAFSSKHEPMNFAADYKVYCLRYVFISCISVAASLVGTASVRIFFKMFEI